MSMTNHSSASAVAANALAIDTRSLNALKYRTDQNSQESIKEAAKQFESLFMREMIKSMRDATMKSGLLDGAEGNLANDLFDQQMSVQMSGQPGGLSEVIQRQLSKQMGGGDSEMALIPGSTLSMGMSHARFAGSPAVGNPAPANTTATTAAAPKGRDEFVQHLSDTAERVEKESGIPASFMLGQAGHETGWGKSEIRNRDGSNSFNLFGIKATKNWTGKVAEITTTEFIDGAPRKVTAKFRAYGSYEESFRDYARLINDNPRYEKAREKTGSAMAYASELQKAGYATDPEYAKKLSGAINSALRAQRAQA